MHTSPKVSIIIPCWNAEKFITDSINSALSQNYPNTEVIVINDGSVDKSRELIDRFRGKITIFNTPRSGANSARNHGLANATGTFVKFLDADDFLLPGCLEAQVEHANHLSNKFFPVGRSFRLEMQHGTIVPHGKRDASARREEKIYETILDVPIIGSPLYRKSDIELIGNFDETLIVRQDFDLLIRLMITGKMPVFINDPAYVYRNHQSTNRLSRQRSEARAQSELKMYKKLSENLKQIRPDSSKADMETGLAHSIWVTARNHLRSGFYSTAIELFDIAKATNPSDHAHGTTAYRYLNNCLGPILSEKLLNMIKRASQ